MNKRENVFIDFLIFALAPRARSEVATNDCRCCSAFIASCIVSVVGGGGHKVKFNWKESIEWQVDKRIDWYSYTPGMRDDKNRLFYFVFRRLAFGAWRSTQLSLSFRQQIETWRLHTAAGQKLFKLSRFHDGGKSKNENNQRKERSGMGIGYRKMNSTLLCLSVVVAFQRTIFNFHVHKMGERRRRKKSSNPETSIPPANVIIIGDAKDRKKERMKSDASIYMRA